MSVFAAADALYSKDEYDRAIPLYEAHLQQQQESLGSFNVDNIYKMSRLSPSAISIVATATATAALIRRKT